jgi:hypothetical protein
MEPMALSFGIMLGFLQQAIAKIKDPRLASNATRYSIKDTVLAAFSVFFMQCESFLEHQRQMHSRCGGGHLLVTLDGTQYFSSQTIHCECCSSRTHKNGNVTYFHSAIVPVIVAPGQPQVISLGETAKKRYQPCSLVYSLCGEGSLG